MALYLIGNFKTVDNSIAAGRLVEQFEGVTGEPSQIDNDAFKMIVDEFIERRNASGWDGIEIAHDYGDVLVVDQMTTQDYQQLKIEAQGLFSHAAINQRHLELFLLFERGGTVDEFVAEGGDIDELAGGFSKPEVFV